MVTSENGGDQLHEQWFHAGTDIVTESKPGTRHTPLPGGKYRQGDGLWGPVQGVVKPGVICDGCR